MVHDQPRSVSKSITRHSTLDHMAVLFNTCRSSRHNSSRYSNIVILCDLGKSCSEPTNNGGRPAFSPERADVFENDSMQLAQNYECGGDFASERGHDTIRTRVARVQSDTSLRSRPRVSIRQWSNLGRALSGIAIKWSSQSQSTTLILHHKNKGRNIFDRTPETKMSPKHRNA